MPRTFNVLPFFATYHRLAELFAYDRTTSQLCANARTFSTSSELCLHDILLTISKLCENSHNLGLTHCLHGIGVYVCLQPTGITANAILNLSQRLFFSNYQLRETLSHFKCKQCYYLQPYYYSMNRGTDTPSIYLTLNGVDLLRSPNKTCNPHRFRSRVSISPIYVVIALFLV